VRASLLLLLLLAASSAWAQTRFRFPAEDPAGDYFLAKPMIGVDHDPTPGAPRTQCVSFEGQPFPYCYNDHDGTDFMLRLGFSTMDNYEVKVVAAAAGEVIAAHDGEYDRCHGTANFEVSCDGHPKLANSVTLRHGDGLVTKYWHLKKGSVAVKVGQAVACGALLGQVGSSGESAAPHLHFEVASKDGAVIDPFAGPKSQPLSYWTLQVGPFGWPGDRCAGAAYPEAGSGPRDGGVSLDRGRDAPASGEPGGVPASGVGCALVAGSPGSTATALATALALALLITWRRSGGVRRRSRSSRR
jgi:hypothetical protein